MAFPHTRLRRLRQSGMLRDLVRETELRASQLVYPLFVEHGLDRRTPIGAMPGVDRLSINHAVEEAAEAEEKRHAFDRSRVEMMRAYAERRGCRRAFILGYFGEDFEPPCGNCDNCDAGSAIRDEPMHKPYDNGSSVRHREWGEGVVQRLDGDKMVVLFETVGYKTLSLELLSQEPIVERA